MTDHKLNNLRQIIKDMSSVLVAFSGGVDSTFLVKVARDVLGDKVVAATAQSPTYPAREFDQAKELARCLQVKHMAFHSDELDIKEFASNPPNRCYYCKKELFAKLQELAKQNGLACVVDGSNFDDRNDFRPGKQAAKELGVRSPLEEAKLTKDEIRQLSKEMGLETWDKPALACLSSRFPYGEGITPDKVKNIGQAEEYLLNLGLKQVRVRYHGPVARIEVNQSDFDAFNNLEFRNKVMDKLKSLGFVYVTLDLKGYRTGSMNEVLQDK